MIKNNLEQAIQEAGRSPEWVRDEYNRTTGKKLSYHSMYKIRKNKQQITLHQTVFFAKVLGISDFRNLILK